MELEGETYGKNVHFDCDFAERLKHTDNEQKNLIS